MRALRTILLTLATVLAALLLVAAGVWIGGRHADAVPSPVRSALTGSTDRRIVNEALDRIEEIYYRKIPRSVLADEAIAGAVKNLNDRFSTYFTPAEYHRFQDAQDSRFTGVGVSVQQDKDGLRIVSVYDGSPAKRGGIAPGDVIVAAGGKKLAGLDSEKSTALIKGPAGTDIALEVRHKGVTKKLTLTRSRISVPVVASTMRVVCGKKIGVVSLSQFSSGAHAEVYRALERLRARGAEGYVFDLRGNGGGLVDEAQLIASAYLQDGVVVTTKGRTVPERRLEATGRPVVPMGAPVAVLVDRDTASASEIVAGALQDRGRATLVGTRTFGKGVFQEVIELSNGGALDITAGQYFTPSGRNLGGRGVSQGRGLEPDVRAKDNPKTRVDEARRIALSTVAAELGCATAAPSRP